MEITEMDWQPVASNFTVKSTMGRFIDRSMHRDTECTDTRIDTVGAVSRYFLKI